MPVLNISALVNRSSLSCSKPSNGSITFRVKTKVLNMPRETCMICPTPILSVHITDGILTLSPCLPPFQSSSFLAGSWIFGACSQLLASAAVVLSTLNDSTCLHNYVFVQHLHLYQVFTQVISSSGNLSCLYYWIS